MDMPLRAFAALEDEVKRLASQVFALHVFAHNKAAQALYAKLGFQPTNFNLYKPLGSAGANPAFKRSPNGSHQAGQAVRGTFRQPGLASCRWRPLNSTLGRTCTRMPFSRPFGEPK